MSAADALSPRPRIEADVAGDIAPTAFVFVLLTGTAAASGGYFPTAWGWSALGCLLVAFAVLVLGAPLSWTRLERAFLGSLLALLAWTASSAAWSASAGRSVLEAERTALYASAALALLLVAREHAATAVVAGAWASATVISTYALTTLLLPDLFGGESLGARLARPVGYSNGLGLLAAVGIALALPFVASASQPALRITAAASLPILASTLYFTLSRGGWLALVLGLTICLALDPHRLTTASSGALLAVAPAAAVAFASNRQALLTPSASHALAVHEGRRTALAIVTFAAISALAESALGPRLRSVTEGLLISARVRVVLVVVLAVSAAAALTWLGAGGGASKVYDAFRTSQQQPTGALGSRVFSAAGNSRIDYWRVALKEYSAHPLLGSGAGTFELYWARERPAPVGSRFAHSLYLQELAELGPAAMVFLALALVTPLIALARARRLPLVPAAAGAYVAVVAHAALDWDWQLPVVTLVAVFTGAAIVRAAGGHAPRTPLSPLGRSTLLGVAVTLAAFTATGWLGNRILAETAAALGKGNYAVAAKRARAARTWQPWASEPWRELGLAQLELGNRAAARASLRQAVSRDRLDWESWFDLAAASNGGARAAALQEALRLNPLSAQVRALTLTGK